MYTLLILFILNLFQLLHANELPNYLQGRILSYKENGLTRTIFDHKATGAKIDYVTNSGICETTPGVNQYSGYLSVGTDENMWFWFFEARNNPSTAPLATWFNGGPGCSSMIGLFQENGPCHFENASNEPSLNPYSWNEYANMLYIDQPIGVGFSYGTNPVNSTVTAAPLVWKLIQAFYAQFPQYENRALGIFTESYGGHYGPEFATYFQAQNRAVDSGEIVGQNIDLKVLAINNGWFDATIQYKALIDYALDNNYRPLITRDQYTAYLDAYNARCLPALQSCTALVGQDENCANAEIVCTTSIEQPLIGSNDFDVYDVRAPRNDPNPPENYVAYLNSPAVRNAIGVKSTYSECADGPYVKFSSTGDVSRSLRPTLSTLLQSGLKTLIWAGDADWICNWYGGLAIAETIDYPEAAAFKSQEVNNYTVKGEVRGQYKTAGGLTWLRAYGAGHEVPFYTPEIALQAIKQMFEQGRLSS